MCNVIHRDITYKNKKTGNQSKYSLGEGNYGMFVKWEYSGLFETKYLGKKKRHLTILKNLKEK